MNNSSCVLVTLTISHWDANRQDKRVSDAVAEFNDVQDKRLCRLRKSLLPKTDVMNRLSAVMRAARTFHYENTHTWMHDGPRVLPRSNYDPYMKQMRRFKAEFETAVLDFISQYDAIRSEAHIVLGKLYNAGDYPLREQLTAKYDFETAIQPMPAASSLLDLGLEAAEAESLRMKLDADMSSIFQKANRRLWDDLYARLEKLYLKLNDEKAYVMEETIEAVRKLADLMPRMNVTNDEKLNVIAGHLTVSLKGVTSEVMKSNLTLREKAAADTLTVFNAMQTLRMPVVPEMSRMLLAA